MRTPAIVVGGMVALGSLIWSGPGLAQPEQYCKEDGCWPQGSAMEVGHQHALRRDAAERQLASREAELQTLLEGIDRGTHHRLGRVLDALRAQQQPWLQYRRAECELIGSLSMAAATWPSTRAVECEANHTELRLRRVRHATRCVQRKLDAGLEADPYELTTCLQQLAPLTNHL